MSLLAPDYPSHWKTVMLEQLLGEGNALAYPVRLWCHCHARMEDRFKMSAKELAALCRYPVADAEKLENALIDARWLERKGKDLIVIGWREHNPGLFANQRNGKLGGRPKKVRDGENPSKTHGQPTENPPKTHGLPIENPRVTDGLATENPWATHRKPTQNREERRGEDITPVVPLQGTSLKQEQLANEAEEFLASLFERKRKRRFGYAARNALEKMVGAGELPLDEEEKRALAAFYARRGEFPGRDLWRHSAEAVAENLPAEIDKARSWLASNDPNFAAKKERRLPPEGWAEWYRAKYPHKTPPATFEELPDYLRDDARKELAV